MPNVSLAFVGAHSSRSSVYTFRSEKSAVEVGQGNLKLTFSADKIKHANYVNSRSSVCDERTCCQLSLLCFFPKNSRQLELFWHAFLSYIIWLSKIYVSNAHVPTLKVKESVEQTFSFYAGYNGTGNDKDPQVNMHSRNSSFNFCLLILKFHDLN
jgi:alpha-mannosidase